MGRIENIKHCMIESRPGICAERALIYTDAYEEYAAEPVVIKRALAFFKTLENMTIYIEDEQLLCGNQASSPRFAPVYPEFAFSWIIDELDEFSSRTSDAFIVSDNTKEELRKIEGFWKNKTLKDRAFAMHLDETIKDLDVKVLSWLGNISSGEGHIIPDYEMLLKEGFIGLKRIIDYKIEKINATDPDDLRKLTFYNACKITLNGIFRFIERYAKLADSMAEKEEDMRKKELQDISCNCKKLLKEPPSNFYEAVQMIWFVHVLMHIESNGHSFSFGRIDQYLYPYYLKDRYEKKIDESHFEDIVGCLYLKIFSLNKVRPWSNSRFQLGYPMYQNICLGGSNLNGEDETNELSFLFIKLLGKIKLSEPNIYVRCHKNMNRRFLEECVEVLKSGIGMPAFVGDDVIVKALMLRGVEEKDAYNYATMGCTETIVPGKWGYKATGKSKVNLLKALEISLYGGKDPRTGIQVLKDIRPLEECSSYEQVYESYKKVLKYYMELQVTTDNINDLAMEEMVPDAFSSMLVQDCIGRGKTIKEGGAIYDIVSGQLSGVVDVGNCLYAIKKGVFVDNLISTSDLKKALIEDFNSNEGIKIQSILKNIIDKYGNDIDDVDEIIRESSDFYFVNISNYKNTRYGRGPIGGIFAGSTVNMSSNVPSGAVVGATPDGRKSGEATSEGISPKHGTEKNGPTAVMKSVVKLSSELVTGGQLFNMRINPSSLKNKNQVDKFMNLLLTYFSLGGWHVQFNVVSNEVLKDAQIHPEEYSDLVIRVAGYSALFTALDKLTQDDIIDRSQYNI